MNNYEHLVEGGIDSLVEFVDKAIECRCEMCVYQHGDWCHISRCKDGVYLWLNSEHIEPDSWDKLLADIDQAASSRGHDTYTDIACRIRNLLNGG